MLSLLNLALALFVLQLQFAYGDTSVLTPLFGLVDHELQVAFNGTLINPPALKIPLSSKSCPWRTDSPPYRSHPLNVNSPTSAEEVTDEIKTSSSCDSPHHRPRIVFS